MGPAGFRLWSGVRCEASRKAMRGPWPRAETRESHLPYSGEKTMAKGKKKLEIIHLVCEETGDYNYTLRRKSGGEKLKIKKNSPRLRKHTLHNEKKK